MKRRTFIGIVSGTCAALWSGISFGAAKTVQTTKQVTKKVWHWNEPLKRTGKFKNWPHYG
jgi:hypothetical protein